MRVCWSILLAGAALAQAPGPTVIRTETRMVLVDAVVTDKNGSVRGLTPKDFHVWEDGKEQTLQSAAFVADPAAPSQPSYLVLLFDNASLDLTAQVRARDAAVQFIEANAGPNRYMAIANFNGAISIAQNFTIDTDRLKRVANEQQIASTAPVISTVARGSASGGAISGTSGVNFGLGLRLLAANLSSVPGRKNVIVFSDGFPFTPDTDSQLKNAIEVCNRNDVAIYPILFQPASQDPNVVQGGGGGRGGRTRNMSINDAAAAPSNQSLNILANGTGGFLYENTNSLVAGLLKVGKDQTEYYLLGYVPAESPEGTCHPLKVRVDRPGVTVRARSTYCNVKSVDLLAGKAVERDLEYRITGDQAGTITASLKTPFFYTEAETARINVAMEIPASAVHFERVKGKSHGELNIVGIAYLPDGTAAARFSDTVKLDLATQKELDVFHAHPVHYEKEFFAAPGTYRLKLAFSSDAEGFGKLEAPLTIEPYDGKQFMLSGLALSNEMHPASELGTVEDAELLEGRTPLLYKDKKIVPSGAETFDKSVPLVVYGEIYEPALAASTPPVVELRMRVVDPKNDAVKSTGAMRPDLTAHAANNMLPFAIKLPVEKLTAGVYRADIEAVDSAGKEMLRSITFEIR